MMKDKTYASLFDKSDYPLLLKMAEKIRITHNQNLTSDFYAMCEDSWNDKRPILEIGNKTIEPIGTSKADDLVVTAGINQLLDQILGISLVRWQYMGKGTGVTAPAAAQTALVTEVTPRIDMSLFGWRENAGSTLRFAGIGSESVATITINEAGIFTAASAGIMLNRNMFSNSPLTHTINTTTFVIASIIEFVPIM
jgi:hypothetical protein